MGLRRKREMVRMMQSPSAFDQSIQVKNALVEELAM
jgi:hypothetical protein